MYDIYVLWASTNDFTGNKECGSWKDYSAADGYDASRLDQFSIQDVGIENFERFYLSDKLHMTEEGYRRIAPAQVSFISRFDGAN